MARLFQRFKDLHVVEPFANFEAEYFCLEIKTSAFIFSPVVPGSIPNWSSVLRLLVKECPAGSGCS
jgi:hypothetical protein